MNLPLTHRKLLYSALVTAMVATQVAAAAWEYMLYPRLWPALLAATLIIGGLGLALKIMLWRSPGHSASRNISMLAKWLQTIDLGSQPLRLPQITPRSDAEARLVAAASDLAERVYRYHEKLLVRHQRVQRLLRNVTDVLYHTDAQGRLVWVTESVAEMLGYTPVELENRLLSELLVDSKADFHLLLESAQLKRQPIRVRRKDGHTAWLLVSSRRIDDTHGRVLGSEGIWRDGTRLIETQQALNQEKERAQVTLASIGDGVITTDAQGIVDYLNPRARTMLGLEDASGVAMRFDTLCRLTDTAREQALTGVVDECIASGRTREWADSLVLSTANGHRQAVKVTIAPIRDAGQAIIGAVIALHDITRLQQVSQEMAYQANHDLITGLPNRRAFENRLAQFQETAARDGRKHALCYLDLDQFKMVNDTCGHDAGDEMLRQIASLLRTRLRTGDILARLGGDEFGVLMEDLSITAAQGKAELLRGAIDTFRFRWQDKLFRLGVSIGLAAIDGNAMGVTELLRRADTACYLAKEKGRNQVYAYHGDADETQTRHGDMERMQQISAALDNNRFTLFAQLIAPLDGPPHARVGVELLLRMRDYKGRIHGPQNFLVTAERYNAASRIDRWVLRRALALISEA